MSAYNYFITFGNPPVANPYQYEGMIYYPIPTNPVNFLSPEQFGEYAQRCWDECYLPKDLREELGPTPLYTPDFPDEPAITDQVYWNIWW
jgi:hypothetical protein